MRRPLVEALTSKVSKFPLKVLELVEVAKEIVDVILSTYSHSIVLPRNMAYLSLLRGLPLWLVRIVQTLDPDPLALAILRITKNNSGAQSRSSYERLCSDSKSHLALKILQTRHSKILPPLAYELGVCPRLHNNTVFQEADDICVLNGT